MTDQIKKQYIAYVQYWSKHHQVESSYCETLMVDYCLEEKPLENYLEFVLKDKFRFKNYVTYRNGWDIKFKDFLKSLITSISICPLHIVQ